MAIAPQSAQGGTGAGGALLSQSGAAIVASKTSPAPSPRTVGFDNPSICHSTWLPMLPASPRAAMLTCPSHGLLKELQTPRKVKSVDVVQERVLEDRRRFDVTLASIRMGMNRMLDTIEEATFVATNEARGVGTVRHELTSPMSDLGDGLTPNEEACAVAEVLDDLVGRAVATMDTPAQSNLPSRGSTADAAERQRKTRRAVSFENPVSARSLSTGQAAAQVVDDSVVHAVATMDTPAQSNVPSRESTADFSDRRRHTRRAVSFENPVSAQPP